MFVDNEIGGAAATGNGEYVMKTLGSFLIVEKIREGFSPQKACEFAVKRIQRILHNQFEDDIQIGYIALNKKGEYGAFALRNGFEFALASEKENNLLKCDYLLD